MSAVNLSRSSQSQKIEYLLNLGVNASENDITMGIIDFLRNIHPMVGHHTEKSTGSRKRVDVVIGGVAIEVKARGKINEPRDKEQLAGYLDELSAEPRPDLGVAAGHKWKGILSDGKDWYFYEHQHGKPIKSVKHIDMADDPDGVARMLNSFINAKILPAPPADNPVWIENLLAPFSDLAKQVGNEPYFDVKQQLWADMLAGAHIVPPGDPEAATDLFVRHTFLVVTARLVAGLVSSSQMRPTEGFAGWIEQERTGDIIGGLREEIGRYDWKIDRRDVLKDFYHAAIPTGIRHDFGEYYTPDWLADAVVEEVLDKEWVIKTLTKAIEKQHRKVQVLDPSCGSGTFIYAAIKRLDAFTAEIPDTEGFFQNPETKAEILNDLVGGIDLHPVAVELAKATKLLALDKDMGKRSLNVWMGDSLQWSQEAQLIIEDHGVITIPTFDGKNLRLPEDFVTSEGYEKKLERVFKTAARKTGEYDAASVKDIDLQPSAHDAMMSTIQTLREHILSGRNGVWQWYMSNVAQPFRLSADKPSRLVGNPPWVVYRSMSPERQKDFRKHAQNRSVWASEANNTLNNDLAALFVATAVDLYLSEDNKFGFVLPDGALTGPHWAPFREGKWGHKYAATKTRADLREAWNLTDVKDPPFKSSPSCVVFGEKTKDAQELDSWLNFSGAGVSPKSSWADVSSDLNRERNRKWPKQSGIYAVKKFRRGATLIPQSLVITEELTNKPGGLVGFETKDGKKPWTNTGDSKLGGRPGLIEKEYAHKTAFSKYLVPFGIVGHAYLIAPILGDGLVDMGEADESEEMESYWADVSMDYEQGRKSGSPETLTGNIDYMSKLSTQIKLHSIPSHEAKIVYIKSGSNLCAAVIPTGLIIDSTLYYHFTETEKEAHYLTAIFNAPTLNLYFKEACRTSNRDFHLGPVKNLPIPEYDPQNLVHIELARLSELAHNQVVNIKPELKDAKNTKQREIVREHPDIKPILEEIGESVARIFPSDYLS